MSISMFTMSVDECLQYFDCSVESQRLASYSFPKEKDPHFLKVSQSERGSPLSFGSNPATPTIYESFEESESIDSDNESGNEIEDRQIQPPISPLRKSKSPKYTTAKLYDPSKYSYSPKSEVNGYNNSYFKNVGNDECCLPNHHNSHPASPLLYASSSGTSQETRRSSCTGTLSSGMSLWSRGSYSGASTATSMGTSSFHKGLGINTVHSRSVSQENLRRHSRSKAISITSMDTDLQEELNMAAANSSSINNNTLESIHINRKAPKVSKNPKPLLDSELHRMEKFNFEKTIIKHNKDSNELTDKRYPENFIRYETSSNASAQTIDLDEITRQSSRAL